MAKHHFIARKAAVTLRRLAKSFPVIGITGPRQSGKTTLAKHCFTDKPYVSLEDPDQLEFAQSDPRRFLQQYPNGAVLDEVQRCPTLFSYLQNIVDQQRQMGQFILTGSEQFGLRAQVSQTLAGRIGLIHLLPLSLDELSTMGEKLSLDELLLNGFYPAIYDRHILPQDWYASYVQTYIERDVQQLIKVKNLATFRTFLRLCAGRAGQIVNLSQLGNDCGVSHNTVKEWLSVLEASYIIFQLPPHYKNFSKRLIKQSKLFFYDNGLLAWLLGIRKVEELAIHAMRGALFENFVVSELLKYQYACGETSNLYFWRDNSGLEIDVILDQGLTLLPIEIKSGQTLASDFFNNLKKWRQLAQDTAPRAWLIYGGEQEQQRDVANVLPWRQVSEVFVA